MRTTFVRFLLLACAAPVLGQEFEVVSIKPNKSMSGGSSSRSDRGMLTASNLSLQNLIMRAYGVKDYQVEGPDWLSAEHFDVAAKFPGELPKDPEKSSAAYQAMLRKMLADRFGLVVHREQKSFTVYGLVMAKGGIKFKEVPDSGSHSSNNDNGHYNGTCISMDTFAGFLARRAELPVLDMTGLKGFYDVKLDITPPTPQPGDPPDSPGSVISVAIQDQLGLKLETRKTPIEVIVVDHAEKAPTDN
jgi:uncharacterized protein (TIGR03435 family)